MAPPTELAIRAELARWLSGELSFDEFWEWLAPLQLRITQPGPARRLLYQIIGRLDEYEHGGWDDAQLRALLTVLIREPVAAD